MQADARHLYVFARCTPTIRQQFEENPVGGQLFNLYLDIDNRQDTGSTELKLGGFYDAVGFDRRVWVTAGVTLDNQTGPRDPTATVCVFPDAVSHEPLWKSTSSHHDAKIAHGPDGVEAVIPLDVLGLRPGAAVRVLLWEHAHFSSREGFNEFMFTVPAQDAQWKTR